MHALRDVEHRLLVVRCPDDADDHAVEDVRRAPDHVEVAVRHGVVRAGADGGDHDASNTVTRACPYLRLVRSVNGRSGSTRAPVSTTSTPFSARTAGRWRASWGSRSGHMS